MNADNTISLFVFSGIGVHLRSSAARSLFSARKQNLVDPRGVALRGAVFDTARFNHSRTSPIWFYLISQLLAGTVTSSFYRETGSVTNLAPLPAIKSTARFLASRLVWA